MAEDIKKMPVGAGLPEMPEEIVIAPKKVAIDWKRIIFILLGLALFFLFYFMPEFSGRGGSLGQALSPAAPRPDGPGPLSHGRGLVDLRGDAHRRHRHRHRPVPGHLYDPDRRPGPERLL